MAERRPDAVRAVDVVRGQARGADARQRLRVAAVVAADHDHQVQAAFVQHAEHGVLAVLGGRADGVHGTEALRGLLLPVAVLHGAAQHLLDLQALAHQHGRLVGEADAGQVAPGIEAGAGGVREAA